MSVLDHEASASVRHHFQIIVRLQMVRAKVSDLVSREVAHETALKDLALAIQSVKRTAKGAGLFGFATACQWVAERFAAAHARGEVTAKLLALIADWSAGAELYVRRPRFQGFARSIILQFNDPGWGSAMDVALQGELLDELNRPLA